MATPAADPQESSPTEESAPLPKTMPPAGKLAGYEFFRKTLGSPKYVVAPMVDQLCYTPMINSSVYVRDDTYRKQNFSTCPEDRPLIAQICGHDPGLLVKTALMLQDSCDAIDLNLGCPQNIARRGHYGAFLAEDWPLVSRLVRALHEHVRVPITCKIRALESDERTVQYAQMLLESGCQDANSCVQMLTVHGRTIKQKGQLTGIANWDVIGKVKAAMPIPVIANGNILYFEDVEHCMAATGVDGVMTAEGNLSNPALFAGPALKPVWQIVGEYMDLVDQYPSPATFIKAHLFRLYHASITKHTDMRDLLAKASALDEFKAVVKEMNTRLRSMGSDEAYVPAPLGGPSHVRGPRSDVPVWVCQPRLHDLEKDEILSQKRGPSTPPPQPVEPKKPKVKKEWDNCACGSPRGSKCDDGWALFSLRDRCEFLQCRACCKKRMFETKAPCESHKLFMRAPPGGEQAQSKPTDQQQPQS